MKRSKKATSTLAALQQAAEQISQRGDFIEKKIRKLDAELLNLGEQMKKTRPGPTHDALKAHALSVLKQKRRYEAQKLMLQSQMNKLERVSSAAEGLCQKRKTVLERLLSFASWNFCK
ncbi:hypothetical protein GOP47_0030007 [Adiantum capillus-veneris]|nr:hypothetical protein GOP47_0030007 [Adiantum capillus-veneris]